MFGNYIHRKPAFTQILDTGTKVIHHIIYYQPSIMGVVEGMKLSRFSRILSIITIECVP